MAPNKTPLSPAFIFADDFSGAHDVGLPFALHGFRTVTLASVDALEASEAADLVIIDTDSRDCDAGEARRRTESACAALRERGGRLVYKKMDSTLRGNIGYELDAVHERLGHAVTLVVPAFPALGRTTVGGYHLVDGAPVCLTAEDDPGHPAPVSSVAELLGRRSRQRIGHVELRTIRQGADAVRIAVEGFAHAGGAVVVLDAAASGDLDTILRAASGMRPPPLLCGAAGLAHPLAAHLAGQAGISGRAAPFVPAASGPVLVVAGSVHSVTLRQVEEAGRHPRVLLCRLDAVALLSDAAPEIERAVSVAVEGLAAARDVLLAPGPPARIDRDAWIERVYGAAAGRDPVAVLADVLGAISRGIFDAQAPAGLVVTGGETAARVARHLGAYGTRIVGKAAEGVAVAVLSGGRYEGLAAVVKPGAFGGADGLTASIRALRPSRRIQAPSGERPILGITMGDPNGVGPEIIAKVLARPGTFEVCRPLVIGAAAVMARDLRFAPAPLEVHAVAAPSEACFRPGVIDVLTVRDADPDTLRYGEVDAAAGRLAVESVTAAAKLALAGEIQGVVTAPLNKEAMHLAGYDYAGHTELLAELTGTTHYRLTLAFDDMLVSHVTTHVSLRRAIELLSEEEVISTIEIIGRALQRMGIAAPRIAVAGLNPHAGENGLFGDEEIRVITPAVERARAAGWRIIGPLPPDTVFLRARRGEFDGIVGMYHDQGHIPVKAIAFDRTVNVSLGMPIIRTSVDHGTAFDIAGKGVADPENLVAALRMAVRLAGDGWAAVEKT